MQFGLCTISKGEQPVTSAMDAAANAGYDGVEIWGKDHVGNGSAATCEHIATEARNRSLSISTYGSYLRPGGDGFTEGYETELDAADALGADLIRVWAGHEEYQDRTDDHWQAVVADLKTVADAAAEQGLGITVEKHEGTLTNRHEGARRLIEVVDRDNCGLNYQPLFSIPAEELLDEAGDLASLSNQMHMQAVPERGGADRCLLEDAFFDIEALLSTFAANDFDGFVNVEFVTDEYDYEEAVTRDLAVLRTAIE